MNYKKTAAVLAAVAIIGSTSYAVTDTLLFNDVVTVSAAVTLRKNSTGSSVTQLQNNLIALKYLKSGSATGKYNSATEAAVKQFQTDYNLTADGVAGTKTINLINGIIDGTAKVMVVKSSLLNVRKSPSYKGKLLTTIKTGQRFQVEDEALDDEGGKWYKITTQLGVGYVCADYVVLNDSSTQRIEHIDSQATKGIIKVTGSVLNVRKSASTSSKKLYTIKQGQTYYFTNAKTVNGDKWYYITVNKKISGWILGKWAVPIETESEIKNVAKSGKLKVVVDILQVRASTSTTSKRLYTTKRDEEYTYSNVKRINNIDWYYIKVNKSISGWVLGTMVSATPKGSETTQSTTQSTETTQSTTASNPDGGTLTVAVNVLNVRQSASTSSKKLFSAKNGQSYSYSKTKKVGSETWYFIKVNNSISGWVLGSMVKAKPNSTQTEAPNSTETSQTASAQNAKDGTLTINTDALNVRESASTSSKKLFVAKRNQTYSYSKTKTVDNQTWYYIKVNNSISGWVMGSYVKAAPKATEASKTTETTKTMIPEETVSGRLKIETSALNIRSDSNTKAKILATAYKGKVYAYSAVRTVNNEKWYRIVFNTNKTGWVNGGFVSIVNDTPEASETTTTVKTEPSSAKTTESQPAQSNAETKSGTLTVDTALLNVRSDASSDASILGTVKRDQTFEYSQTKVAGNITWYYIKVSDVRSGWVMGTYIKVKSEKEPAAPASAQSGTLTVVGSSVNVRKGAGTNYGKITTVKSGSTYPFSDAKDGWYLIKVSEKQSGWIIGDYVKVNESAPTTAKTDSPTKPTSAPETTATTKSTTSTKPTQTTTGIPVSPTAAAISSRTVLAGTVSISSGTLTVRKEASKSAAKIGSLANGTSVIVISQGSSWHQIEFNNGIGYVSASCIKSIKSVKLGDPLSYEEEYHYIKPGQSINLGRTVEGAVVTYTSSDPKNCPVTETGVASGVKAGLYTITATCGSKSAVTYVVVQKNPNSNIKSFTVSDKGIDFIAELEGGATVLLSGEKVFYPSKDVSGFWTLGYGHAMTTTASKSWDEKRALDEFNKDIEQLIGAQYKMTSRKPYLTEDVAKKLLKADLTRGDCVRSVNNWASRNGVKLNQAQFDALVSFCFNIGSSLWESDSNKFYLKSAILAYRSGSEAVPEQIIDGFCRYHKAGGNAYKGLWYRRRNEADLFVTGNYSINKADKYTLPTDISWS